MKLLAGIGAAVALASAGPAWADEPKAVTQRDVVDIEPAEDITIDTVTIDNRLGNVTVKGHDARGVTIRAVKRAPDADTMDRLKVSLVPDPAGPVRIRTSLLPGDEARPVAAGSVRVDLVIYVPRAAFVGATTWNGHVALERLDAGAEVATNKGDIKVKNCSGDIKTHAAQGAQEFVEVLGGVDAEGVAGSMTFQIVKGERLGARIHEGSIDARQIRAKNVKLRATTGDISFDGDIVPGGSYSIVAFRGDVNVSFRKGAAFRVEALAKRGTVEAASALAARATTNGLIGTYGGGKSSAGVFVSTNFGDVKVGFAEEAKTF